MSASHGQIEIVNGYTFFWNAGPRHGEIFGHVEAPYGGIVRGFGGWFHTTKPQEAADMAERSLIIRGVVHTEDLSPEYLEENDWVEGL